MTYIEICNEILRFWIMEDLHIDETHKDCWVLNGFDSGV